MQIVSEAIFQYLKEPTLLYASTHNKIVFVSQNQLILKQIALDSNNHVLKIKGYEISAISLQNPHFIVILYSKGIVQVRKIENISQIIFSVSDILIRDHNPKIRVTADAIYILSCYYVDKISFKKELQRQQIYYQGQRINDVASDMLISQVLQQQKIMLFQFKNFISFNIWGVPITKLNFQNLLQMKILKDPLMILDKSRQFLVIIEDNKYLKVYDMANLQQILQMGLFVEKDENIQIKIDPLNQYMILRVFNKNNKTLRNNLLKINKEYYIGQSHHSFFLFDLELGLTQDLILFPTHQQTIKGVKFHSIDMLYFTQKSIKLATLVVDAKHKTKLRGIKHMDLNWRSVDHWQQILLNLKSPANNQAAQIIAASKNDKKIDLQYKQNYAYDSQVQFDNLLNKFLQQNYQNMKNEKKNIQNKLLPEKQKYLQNGLNAIIKPKQKIQHEDGLNTLSGSSSFRSIDSANYQLQEKILKIIQKDYLSQQQHNIDKSQQQYHNNKNDIEDKRNYIVNQEQSQLEFYQNQIQEEFQPYDEKIDLIQNKINRFQNLYINQCKKIERKLRFNTKQLLKIDRDIPQICQEEMKNYTIQMTENLNHFKSMISRIQIMGTRNLKKIKKKYKDFLNEEIQNCTERLEESELSSTKVQNLMKKLGAE